MNEKMMGMVEHRRYVRGRQWAQIFLERSFCKGNLSLDFSQVDLSFVHALTSEASNAADSALYTSRKHRGHGAFPRHRAIPIVVDSLVRGFGHRARHRPSVLKSPRVARGGARSPAAAAGLGEEGGAPASYRW